MCVNTLVKVYFMTSLTHVDRLLADKQLLVGRLLPVTQSTVAC